jgi:vacuolar-type H+-ATPase subunit I/STV1
LHDSRSEATQFRTAEERLHDNILIMEILKKYKLLLIFGVVGAVGGFLYWKFVGCQSGTCPIKSVWYWSTLYGALFGLLAGSIIRDIVVKFKKKTEDGRPKTED